MYCTVLYCRHQQPADDGYTPARHVIIKYIINKYTEPSGTWLRLITAEYNSTYHSSRAEKEGTKC